MPKGVMSPKVAQMAIKVGLDAVWVSNHGGRAFDGVQATITMLPRIAQAVDGRVPIVFDSGVRRADHVFKALALGATVVGMGRPIMYGLALGGAEGVHSVLEHVRNNLTIVMRLAGTKNVKEITRITWHRRWWRSRSREPQPNMCRHGRACPGHPRLASCQRRGCPARGRA